MSNQAGADTTTARAWTDETVSNLSKLSISDEQAFSSDGEFIKETDDAAALGKLSGIGICALHPCLSRRRIRSTTASADPQPHSSAQKEAAADPDQLRATIPKQSHSQMPPLSAERFRKMTDKVSGGVSASAPVSPPMAPVTSGNSSSGGKVKGVPVHGMRRLNSKSSLTDTAGSPHIHNPAETAAAARSLMRNAEAIRRKGADTPTVDLVETAVSVREVSKRIGRTVVQINNIRNIMIVTKPNDSSLVSLTRDLAIWLIESALDETCSYNTSSTSPSRTGLVVYIEERLALQRSFNLKRVHTRHPLSETNLKYWTPELCASSPELFDFVITLGGDGTVLYTSWLFQTTVPPIIPFHLGSLGFLTVFDHKHARRILGSIINSGVRINLRMRFNCTVYRLADAVDPECANLLNDAVDCNRALDPIGHCTKDIDVVPGHKFGIPSGSSAATASAASNCGQRLGGVSGANGASARQARDAVAAARKVGAQSRPRQSAQRRANTLSGLSSDSDHKHSSHHGGRSGKSHSYSRRSSHHAHHNSSNNGSSRSRHTSTSARDHEDQVVAQRRESLESNVSSGGTVSAGKDSPHGYGCFVPVIPGAAPKSSAQASAVSNGSNSSSNNSGSFTNLKHGGVDSGYGTAPSNTKPNSAVKTATEQPGPKVDMPDLGVTPAPITIVSEPAIMEEDEEVEDDYHGDAAGNAGNAGGGCEELKIPLDDSISLSRHSTRNESEWEDLPKAYQRKMKRVWRRGETFQVMNELVVDRGPSPYLSQLELYGDGNHLTTVEADGLCLATPTGSTAYSLAAGGSLVHPEIPAILVTPICPHTLSFRPMLLPDSMVLRVVLPPDSRNTAWASFDGRHRIELHRGDHIQITASRYPLPTVCASHSQTQDWMESISRCLNWNERQRQKKMTTRSMGYNDNEGESEDMDENGADEESGGDI